MPIKKDKHIVYSFLNFAFIGLEIKIGLFGESPVSPTCRTAPFIWSFFMSALQAAFEARFIFSRHHNIMKKLLFCLFIMFVAIMFLVPFSGCAMFKPPEKEKPTVNDFLKGERPRW